MDIFEFESYKKYTLKRIEAQPKKGYGQLKRLSEFMGVSTTFVSQVFQGEKSLNLEQGTAVCEFLSLTELETEYYLKLILIERAGTEKLRKILLKEASKVREHAHKIINRLSDAKVISDEHKVIFYSEWYMSAIRLLTSIQGYQDVDSIAEYFHLPRKTVMEAVNFLVKLGLIKNEKGFLEVGPSHTHLGADSPFVKSHHSNWRLKAMENMNFAYDEKLHYTSPTTIGKKDAMRVRAEIVKFIEGIGEIIDPSPNEELMCLNIDWFKVQPR